MECELKQEFTRRISCCNRGELIIIVYDICFAYVEEAEEAYAAGNYGNFTEAVRKAQSAVVRLRDALDFKYEISRELYSLYQFASEQLSKSIYKNDTEGLKAAQKVLKDLYAGFGPAAAQDTSEPLMRHTQQVVAGMTYQKGSLTETCQDSDTPRGFLA